MDFRNIANITNQRTCFQSRGNNGLPIVPQRKLLEMASHDPVVLVSATKRRKFKWVPGYYLEETVAALEGRNGFFKIVSRHPFELAPFGGGNQHYRIMRCHLKQFPLGNYGQPVVTAALEARALVGDVRDIAEVHVRSSQ